MENPKPAASEFDPSPAGFMSRWLQPPQYPGLIDVAMVSNLPVMVIVGASQCRPKVADTIRGTEMTSTPKQFIGRAARAAVIR